MILFDGDRDRVLLYWVFGRMASLLLFVASIYAVYLYADIWWAVHGFVILVIIAITPLNIIAIPWTIWTGMFVGFCPFCGVPHLEILRYTDYTCSNCGDHVGEVSSNRMAGRMHTSDHTYCSVECSKDHKDI